MITSLRHRNHLFDELDAAIEHARSHVTRAATAAGGTDVGDFGWTSAIRLPRD